MGYAAFDLKGKVALITGGNGGIGLGMAEALAEAGADVCIWGTNEEKNLAASKQLAKHGTRVLALRCDVSDEAAVERALVDTLARFGRIDGCFANAGVMGVRRKFHELTSAEWSDVLDVNLDGLFYTLRGAARHMVERSERGDRGGRLIGISSLGALCGMARSEAYAASKGAVISLMQALAVEYARHGITANSILPGYIETAMTTAAYENKKFADALLPRIPLRRWGKPTDFGGLAIYLMSDASAYHTGDKFLIDGGFFLY